VRAERSGLGFARSALRAARVAARVGGALPELRLVDHRADLLHLGQLAIGADEDVVGEIERLGELLLRDELAHARELVLARELGGVGRARAPLPGDLVEPLDPLVARELLRLQDRQIVAQRGDLAGIGAGDVERVDDDRRARRVARGDHRVRFGDGGMRRPLHHHDAENRRPQRRRVGELQRERALQLHPDAEHAQRRADAADEAAGREEEQRAEDDVSST